MNINDFITIPLTTIQNFYEEAVDLSDILRFPGVLGIHCFAENRTYVFQTHNCWFSMCILCEDLVFNRTSDSHELSRDKFIYGLENLSFVLFAIGPKWQNLSERKKKLQEIEQNWEHGFYAESEF